MSCNRRTIVGRLFLRALFFVSLGLSGCVGDSKESAEQTNSVANFDFIAMFANYADNIIVPNYQRVLQRAEVLTAAEGPLTEYCAAIGTANEATALLNVESAWDSLQSAIQQSESHLLGPATDNGGALSNRLNAFHAGGLSTCGIDQAAVLAAQDAEFNLATRAVNQRGIGAVEYLLFNPSLTHTCPSQISETQNWDSRSEDERKRLRCDYAFLVSEDIASAASSLVHAWQSDGGNYRSTFLNPLNNQVSLKALSDAMFYLELAVKDIKLGLPLGINNQCSGFSCPQRVESPYRQTSLQNIRDNVQAFELMFTGDDGLGFDDIIARAGVSNLNDRFLSNIAAVIAAIDSQSVSLLQQAAMIVDSETEAECINAYANPMTPSAQPSCSLYGLIKLITDDLKIGFVAAVDVDLPDRGQSDND